MFRFLFRSLGSLLLAAAFAALIVDATRSIAGGRVLVFSLDDTAQWLLPASLAAVRRAAAAHDLGPWLARLLALPTWLFLAAVGGLLAALGRRPPVRRR
ncbi:MAG TPA: hypothetical protein VH414_10470 [Lichenihabitans sp.]|jgi:hypothetical protein|nr:hypothetical protein [Lichenihabitans sp.]